jgi:hypothetical protein
VIGSHDISLTATFFDVLGVSVVAMFFFSPLLEVVA